MQVRLTQGLPFPHEKPFLSPSIGLLGVHAAPVRGVVRMSGSVEGSSRREVMGGMGAGLAALVLTTNLQPALADRYVVLSN